jgi:fatty acid desaturase
VGRHASRLCDPEYRYIHLLEEHSAKHSRVYDLREYQRIHHGNNFIRIAQDFRRMTVSISPARDQERFRKFTLALAAALTLVAILYVAGGITGTLPFERGYGSIAAGLAGIVFIIFVVPALLLALFNRLIGVAFSLALLGLVCYIYAPLLRFIAWVSG